MKYYTSDLHLSHVKVLAYYHESFRAITVSAAENMARKMLRDGQNVFMPHDMMESKEPDCKTAFEWYSKAAEHGDLDSMHNTAMMLITGNGCPRDACFPAGSGVER